MVAFAATIAATGYAQQNVGIGTTTPNASAALDVSSNNKGILIPRLDSAQRVAISNPAEGLMVYQKMAPRDSIIITALNGAWLAETLQRAAAHRVETPLILLQ